MRYPVVQGAALTWLATANHVETFAPSGTWTGRRRPRTSGTEIVARQHAPRISQGGGRGAAAPTMAYDISTSPNRWGNEPLEPGFGGIWPGDPNAETHRVRVMKDGEEVASLDVPVDRYIYFAFEVNLRLQGRIIALSPIKESTFAALLRLAPQFPIPLPPLPRLSPPLPPESLALPLQDAGIELPMHNGRRMCRNGCCTTCAARVTEGRVKMEGALGLLKSSKKDGYALLCCSYPRADVVCELQKEDEVYEKQFGDSFEEGGVEWGGFLPEED
ncbi:unnamed protein product [Phaeothamnion confervicola]